LVEDGSTFFRPGDLDDVRRVAAAGALGVEGVDGAALEGLTVSSTKPDSFSVSECSITWTS
jgi:hypothetical protein